jgi:hypothetical protein
VLSIEDNTISMEIVDDYLSELWRRRFSCRRGFGTLNISAKSAIDIYSYVAKITEDFLNEYNRYINDDDTYIKV